LAVNVRGAFNVTRRIALGMAERGFGRVVFLCSVSVERGGGVCGGVANSAAKAGQLRFTRALARELGPHGVTVNAVAPGLIDTGITGGALEGDRKAQLIAGVPVGRNGTVADVADLITYLCRQESGCTTGATYDVNGGSHIHRPPARWNRHWTVARAIQPPPSGRMIRAAHLARAGSAVRGRAPERA